MKCFSWVFLRKDICRLESWQPVSYVKHVALLTISGSGVERLHLHHISVARLQSAVSVRAECFEEGVRMPSDKSKLQVTELQEV